jgi:hypothetical protein
MLGVFLSLFSQWPVYPLDRSPEDLQEVGN